MQSAGADLGVDVNTMTYGIFNFVSGNGSESLGTFLSQSVVKITSLSKSGPGNIYDPKLGGTITVWVTEQGITGDGATLFTQGGLTSNTLSSGWTVNESLWIDPNNGLYSEVDHVLPSTSGTFIGLDHADARNLNDLSLSLNNPYSITEVYTITAPAYGTAHLTLGQANLTETVNFTAVPRGLHLGDARRRLCRRRPLGVTKRRKAPRYAL